MADERKVARVALYEDVLRDRSNDGTIIVIDSTQGDFEKFVETLQSDDTVNYNKYCKGRFDEMDFISSLIGAPTGKIIILYNESGKLKLVCLMTFMIGDDNAIIIRRVDCLRSGFCTLLFYRFYSHNLYELTSGNLSDYTISISMSSKNISACYCYHNSAENMGFDVKMSDDTNCDRMLGLSKRVARLRNNFNSVFTIIESEREIKTFQQLEEEKEKRKELTSGVEPEPKPEQEVVTLTSASIQSQHAEVKGGGKKKKRNRKKTKKKSRKKIRKKSKKRRRR